MFLGAAEHTAVTTTIEGFHGTACEGGQTGPQSACAISRTNLAGFTAFRSQHVFCQSSSHHVFGCRASLASERSASIVVQRTKAVVGGKRQVGSKPLQLVLANRDRLRLRLHRTGFPPTETPCSARAGGTGTTTSRQFTGFKTTCFSALEAPPAQISSAQTSSQVTFKESFAKFLKTPPPCCKAAKWERA
eukprot:6473772-Amphidinium_carterae.1